MKEYWLVINEETKSIEICFPNRKMYTINACLSTLQRIQREELLTVLKGVLESGTPVKKVYEYFSMDIDPSCIIVVFSMFEEVKFYLFTVPFTQALEEYLRAYDKLAGRMN